MKTNQEIRNEITTAFKAKGWNNRKVGLKVDYGSINATVKDLSIPLKDVEELVKSYEEIDYDVASGEILCGANTFVFVRYDYKAMETARNEHMEKAEEIFETNKGNIVDIMECGNRKLKFYGDCGNSWVETSDGTGRRFAGNAYALAEAMAIFNAQGGI